MAYILVVDDLQAQQDLMARFLETDGHQVTAVGSATAGLDAARGTRPDLILLDLLLPDARGLDALRELGRLAPVIVVSAFADVGSVVAALDAGAIDHIAKPWSGEILLARVRAALRRGGVTLPPTREIP